MKKIIVPVITCCFLSSQVLNAQINEVRMSAGIAVAIPSGQFRDLVDNPSLRSAEVSLLYGITDRFSIGLNGGFQDFYQKFSRAVYKQPDGSDISAVITNSVQTIPLLATAQYQLNEGGIARPYVSVGAGGAIVVNTQYAGEYANENNKIGFSIKPGLGIYIPFRRDGAAGLKAGVHYTHISYKKEEISNLGFIGISVSIAFPMRQ